MPSTEKTFEDVIKFFKENPEYKNALVNHYEDVVFKEFMRQVALSHQGDSDMKAFIQASTIQLFVLDVFK